MEIRRATTLRTLALVAGVCASTALAGVALASGTSLTTEKAKAGKVIDTTTGRAVYMFSRDTSSKSNCSGKCASAWPPVTGSANVAKSSGLNAKLLGTIKRSASQTQVTYNHHPLYFYSRDKSHATKGEGASAFGGHWYLLGPKGTAVKPAGHHCNGLCQGY